jgi:Family of unknown function (DUF6152)
MKRRLLLSLLAILVSVASAVAHHGYAEYDRDKLVVMEGDVTKVLWANPHVVITLRTESQGEYSVEWGSLLQLTRQGINVGAIKSGDHVSITGCVNRNPEKRILTLVRQILRPADGWKWANPRYVPSA